MNMEDASKDCNIPPLAKINSLMNQISVNLANSLYDDATIVPWKGNNFIMILNLSDHKNTEKNLHVRKY